MEQVQVTIIESLRATLPEGFLGMAEVFSAIEKLGDPKEKLRKKDDEFIKRIKDFLAEIQLSFRNREITLPEARLFLLIYILFNWLERILWELKGYDGDPPGLPPLPSPTPGPQHEPQPGTPHGPQPDPKVAAGVAPIAPTGEQTRTCGQKNEEDVYSYDGDEAPPQKTVTGHSKNSDGMTECQVEFKFYTAPDGQPAHTDTVSKGNSTPSRQGRWRKVTAKCLTSQVQNPECRISWTVAP